MSKRWSAVGAAFLFSVAACGGGAGSADAGGQDGANLDAAGSDSGVDGTTRDGRSADATSDRVCISDQDCSDGVYCNGTERCMPGAVGASADGCVRATSGPCSAESGMTCNEALHRCDGTACHDNDNDGVQAPPCGPDCDDSDARRSPANPEVCDAQGLDEDCNPCTVAQPAIAGMATDGDADGDGYDGAGCFNTFAGSTPRCDLTHVAVMGARVVGTDCNDTDTNVHPDQTDACNGKDDNCNGLTDEDPPGNYYPDCDGDGFGDHTAAGQMGCSPAQFPACSGHAVVPNNTDCNDASATVHPGLPEACDGVDNDCNGSTDDDPSFECAFGQGPQACNDATCGGAAGTRACNACHWSECVRNAGRTCAPNSSAGCTVTGGGASCAGTKTCNADCTYGGCVVPGETVCDRLDNDCDGQVDEGLATTCDATIGGSGSVFYASGMSYNTSLYHPEYNEVWLVDGASLQSDARTAIPFELPNSFSITEQSWQSADADGPSGFYVSLSPTATLTNYSGLMLGVNYNLDYAGGVHVFLFDNAATLISADVTTSSGCLWPRGNFQWFRLDVNGDTITLTAGTPGVQCLSYTATFPNRTLTQPVGSNRYVIVGAHRDTDADGFLGTLTFHFNQLHIVRNAPGACDGCHPY